METSTLGRLTTRASASARSAGAAAMATVTVRARASSSSLIDPSAKQREHGSYQAGAEPGGRVYSFTGAVPGWVVAFVLHRQALIGEALAMALCAEGVHARGLQVSPGVPPPGRPGAGEGFEDVEEATLFERPDLALICVDDCWSAAEVAEMVGGLSRMAVAVVLVTDERLSQQVASGMAAGADAVISTSEPLEKITCMIEKLSCGEPLMCLAEREKLRRDLLGRACSASETRDSASEMLDRLTPREREILLGLVKGLRPKAISEASFTSIDTVRSHIRSIRQKLGVTSQLEAVALANQAGWLNGVNGS